MRGVSAGAGVHDGDRQDLRVLVLCGIHRLKRVDICPLRKRNRAHIEDQILVVVRIPLQKLRREPVGRLRLARHGQLLISVLLCHGILCRRCLRRLFCLSLRLRGRFRLCGLLCDRSLLRYSLLRVLRLAASAGCQADDHGRCQDDADHFFPIFLFPHNIFSPLLPFLASLWGIPFGASDLY